MEAAKPTDIVSVTFTGEYKQIKDASKHWTHLQVTHDITSEWKLHSEEDQNTTHD